MQTKTVLHLNAENADWFQFQSMKQGSHTSAENKRRMAAFLAEAIENELTERQRMCVSALWFSGKKQKEIAQELGLSRSTVCRHIAAAKRKLRRLANYSPAPVGGCGGV